MSGFSIQNTGTISAYDSNASQSISSAFHQGTQIYTQSLRIYDNVGGWLYNSTDIFYVTRNDPSGRDMYTNGVMSQYGGFRTYSYQHWTDTVYYNLDLTNNTPDDIYVMIEVQDSTPSAWTTVVTYTQVGPGNYNSNLVSTAFTPTRPNLTWRYRFSIQNLTTPNFGNVLVVADDYDYSTNLYINGGPLDFNDQFQTGYQIPVKWTIGVN